MSPITILLIILIWLYIPKDSDYSVERQTQQQQDKNQQRKGIQKKRLQVIREAITEVKKTRR